MDILEKVKHTISEHHMLQKGESVLIALSGGPDSVFLAYILDKLRKSFSLQLSAAHIVHNIRPGVSKREEKVCQEICDNFQIELFVVSEDIPDLARKTKKGIEEASREFRYGVFEKLSSEFKFDKVALGHNLDDRVETVLFRIIRGTGRTGLSGIKAKRDKIIRPLYDIGKSEITRFLDSRKIKYCIDKSNTDIRYRRNFIRHKLLPYIRENLNPAVDRAILNLSETSLEEEIYLSSLTEKALKKTVRSTPGGKIELAIENLKSYDRWLRRRILRYCITKLSETKTMPDRDVVERLEDNCIGKTSSISLPEKLSAKTVDGKLVIFKNKMPGFSRDMEINKKFQLDRLDYKIKTKLKKIEDVVVLKERRSLKVQLNYDKITMPLKLRSIKAGDRFKPLGLKGNKKVGDYLTDRKTDKIYRDEIPVLCDQKGIIWLVGFEIAQRVKIDKTTSEVLEIELSRSKKYRVEAV